MTIFDEEIPLITPTWTRDIWLLDPGPFIDIAFDMGFRKFVFRAKYHEYPNMQDDFTKIVDIHARGREWKVLWVPYPGDFVVRFTSERGWKQHDAVWPIWRPADSSFDRFEKLFFEPSPPGTIAGAWGTASRVSAKSVEVTDWQDHGVVVAGYPRPEEEWAQIASFLQQRQAERPNYTIHSHGQKSIGRTIGIACKSFDHPVRIGWDNGMPKILLPNGMMWATEREPAEMQRLWLSVIGVDHKRIFDVRGKELSRRIYDINLRSLRWAMLNWDRAWDFRRTVLDEDDIEISEMDWSPQSLPIRLRKTKTERANLDRWLCDSCSLQNKCPYSRQGSVCIVPDSDPEELTRMFGTRNSAQIIQGLSAVLQSSAQRMNRALRQEQELSDEIEENDHREEDEKTGKKKGPKKKVVLSRELTNLQNSIFKNGIVLAKMVDPNLAKQMGPKTQVSILNVGQPQELTPQALMAGVANILTERGISLADASDAMIQEVLTELAGGQPVAIEATSHEEQPNDQE